MSLQQGEVKINTTALKMIWSLIVILILAVVLMYSWNQGIDSGVTVTLFGIISAVVGFIIGKVTLKI